MSQRHHVLGALSCAALLLSAAGCAGPRITGRIVDQHGKPLPGAVVHTEPLTEVRIAGPDGHFHLYSVMERDRITDLRTGTYALHVRKLGCRLEAPLEVRVESGDNRLGEVRLHCRELTVKPERPEANEEEIVIPRDPPIIGE